MRTVLTLLFLSSGFLLHAQEYTFEGSSPTSELPGIYERGVMIVPFLPHRLKTDQLKALTHENARTYEEVSSQLRKELTDLLYMSLKERFPVAVYEEQEQAEDRKIYEMIHYDWESLPDTSAVWWNEKEIRVRNKNAAEATRVEAGQIISVPKRGRQFMNASVEDPIKLRKIRWENKIDYYLVINQLDVETVFSLDPFVESREVLATTHFSLLDLRGKEMMSGVCQVPVPPAARSYEGLKRKILPETVAQLRNILAKRLIDTPAAGEHLQNDKREER